MDLLNTIAAHWPVAVPLIISTCLFVAMLFGIFDDHRIDL